MNTINDFSPVTHSTVYTVKENDSPWAVAKKTTEKWYKNRGQKPTNAEIVKEMNRLAKLNGCKTPEELNEKFFNKVGNHVLVSMSIHQKGHPQMFGFGSVCCDGKTNTTTNFEE